MEDQLQVCALRSGSSGNAIVVSYQNTNVLIDAGVCCRAIEQSLSEISQQAANINAIFVTHEHVDHIAGVGVMMRRYQVPVYCTPPTWEAMKKNCGKIDEKLIRLILPGQTVEMGSLALTGFSTSHDAADPVGYSINSRRGSLSIMTDSGQFSETMLQAIKGSRAIMIEANYDPGMLMAGRYPYMLKKRIKGSKGHLSNDDCADAIIKLLKKGTEHFQLVHLSQDNNYPELAYLTVRQSLETEGAVIGKDLTLDIARRHKTSQPFFF